MHTTNSPARKKLFMACLSQQGLTGEEFVCTFPRQSISVSCSLIYQSTGHFNSIDTPYILPISAFVMSVVSLKTLTCYIKMSFGACLCTSAPHLTITPLTPPSHTCLAPSVRHPPAMLVFISPLSIPAPCCCLIIKVIDPKSDRSQWANQMRHLISESCCKHRRSQ